MYPWGEEKINKPQIFAGWPGAIGRPGPLESGLDTWCRAGVTGARVFFWHIFRPRFPYRVVRWENDRKSKKWSIPIFTDEWDETFFAEAEVLLRAMAARNMTLIATILDYKSIHYGEGNVEDPWRANWKWWEQLWPGHRFCTEGMAPHTLKWLDKIIPFLSSTSINYFVETINEFYIPDEKDSRFRWHKWLVNELEKRGIERSASSPVPDQHGEPLQNRGIITRHIGLSRQNSGMPWKRLSKTSRGTGLFQAVMEGEMAMLPRDSLAEASGSKMPKDSLRQ